MNQLTYHSWALRDDEMQASGKDHLDHIADRGGVWYVGLGHLYPYNYAHERGLINVICTPEDG